MAPDDEAMRRVASATRFVDQLAQVLHAVSTTEDEYVVDKVVEGLSDVPAEQLATGLVMFFQGVVWFLADGMDEPVDKVAWWVTRGGSDMFAGKVAEVIREGL